ncbi:MAG: DNA/RNA helicase domain-containing protein [Adhaeribacter sp.]
MIVYQATKESFQDDILTNNIENIILDAFRKKNLKSNTSKGEINSWKHSLMYMQTVLADPNIPEDCGVAIEYHIPQTSKRIDFILTGKNEQDVDHAILIELKQWSKAELTQKDAIVQTYVGGGNREQTHPSYQAWSYAALLEGFNEMVYQENIQLKPCAYLHNYDNDGVINNPFYADYINKAPLFLKSDARKLRDFIKQFVKYGDSTNIMYRIESGRIKPSKMLADSLVSMLKGNQEFVMIDDQKVVYETALTMAKHSSDSNKNVLIVEGGPGTGKSVVAINLLVELTKAGLLTHYVSKNAAPRTVYASKLTGSMKKTLITNFFKGSGSFLNFDENAFDALIVDEAHRLNEKSGLYSNLGENQIKEIISCTRFSVFFIDEDQMVTLSDIGEKSEIRRWATSLGAKVTEMELSSQFRCNGSDGYLAWVDDVLQIRETANQQLDGLEYDFRVMDNPNELRDLILEKNLINNKARMVAGYCWNWVSKKNPDLFDVVIPEYDFEMRWNLIKDGSLWMINPDSVTEIGCIHTSQGLEVDFIGVVIGPDLIVRNGEVITVPAARARTDASIRGYKRLLEQNPAQTQIVLDNIIKNTYRTLMTRGMKGCYIYCTDQETGEYFRSRISQNDLAHFKKTNNYTQYHRVQ